jgi:hypothetical protein
LTSILFLNKIEMLFIPDVECSDHQTTDREQKMSSDNSNNFLGVYQRGLYGGSRFVWNIDTLRIIIRGFFQFHRSGRKLPLHLIAPHLRSLIREHVKCEVCVWDGHYHNWAADHFDRICDRWVRLPSIRAVLLKLQEYSVIAYLVSTTEASYQSLCDDGIISKMFSRAIDLEMARMRSSHPSCTANSLPAVPRPSPVPVFGYCFHCGVGLSDKVDFNFIPRCCCLGGDSGGGGDDICLCSYCFDDFLDE